MVDIVCLLFVSVVLSSLFLCVCVCVMVDIVCLLFVSVVLSS